MKCLLVVSIARGSGNGGQTLSLWYSSAMSMVAGKFATGAPCKQTRVTNPYQPAPRPSRNYSSCPPQPPPCPQLRRSRTILPSFRRKTKQATMQVSSTKRYVCSERIRSFFPHTRHPAFQVSNPQPLRGAHADSKDVCYHWRAGAAYLFARFQCARLSCFQHCWLGPSSLFLLQGDRITNPSRWCAVAHILGGLWIFQLLGILCHSPCLVLRPVVLRPQVNLHCLAPTSSFPGTSYEAILPHLAYFCNQGAQVTYFTVIKPVLANVSSSTRTPATTNAESTAE